MYGYLYIKYTRLSKHGMIKILPCLLHSGDALHILAHPVGEHEVIIGDTPPIA